MHLDQCHTSKNIWWITMYNGYCCISLLVHLLWFINLEGSIVLYGLVNSKFVWIENFPLCLNSEILKISYYPFLSLYSKLWNIVLSAQIYGLSAWCLGHNLTEKKLVSNIQNRPWTRLVRGNLVGWVLTIDTGTYWIYNGFVQSLCLFSSFF